jgi:hypothetical protein
MSRLPNFLDNRLIDGSEVVGLKHQLPFASRKIPDTHFSKRATVQLEELGKLKNPVTLSGITSAVLLLVQLAQCLD